MYSVYHPKYRERKLYLRVHCAVCVIDTSCLGGTLLQHLSSFEYFGLRDRTTAAGLSGRIVSSWLKTHATAALSWSIPTRRKNRRVVPLVGHICLGLHKYKWFRWWGIYFSG